MRRLFAWGMLILAAFLVLTGVIDLAIGPELESQETGGSGPRWYGALYLLVGLALGALGHRLDHRAPRDAG